MKIVQIHGRYRSAAPSGENRVVDQEAELLRADGHRVERYERHSDEIAQWPLRRKATLPMQVVWSRPAEREVASMLKAVRPDVVHVHNTFPLISASVLRACRDAEVPVVATLHNYKLLCASGDFFRDGRICHDCAEGSGLTGLRRGCYRGSRVATVPVAASIAWNRTTWRDLVSAFVFISSSQRDLMHGLQLPQDRVFVKHNHVPVRVATTGSRRPQVAYLGRLDEAKGITFLMRAWNEFVTRHPRSSLRLVVAGSGPLEDVVQAWAGRHDTVDLAGLLDPAAAADLLRHSLAALVPSQWEETFGLVAVEAMAAGVAPVVPARGSFVELVDDQVDGVLYEPDDPGELVNILSWVDRDPQHFIRLGRAALTTHRTRFSAEMSLMRLMEVYRFAIAHPIGARHVRT